MVAIAHKIFEPAIEEIFNDPIMKQLMKTDKVDELTLYALLRDTAKDMRLKSDRL